MLLSFIAPRLVKSHRQLRRTFAVQIVRELGDPVLRVPATKVDNFGSKELDELVVDLIDTMRANNGAGIAAPQIGVSMRVFVVEGKGDNPRYPYKPVIPLTVFCNPRVEVVDSDQPSDPIELIEGCLSIPGFRGSVTRAAKVRVIAQHTDGTKFVALCSGHAAGTMQHEFDHLNSTLFPDRSGADGLMTSAAFDQYHGGADFMERMAAINREHPVPILFES